MLTTYDDNKVAKHAARRPLRLAAFILWPVTILLFLSVIWWTALKGMDTQTTEAWAWTLILLASIDGAIATAGWWFQP